MAAFFEASAKDNICVNDIFFRSIINCVDYYKDLDTEAIEADFKHSSGRKSIFELESKVPKNLNLK